MWMRFFCFILGFSVISNISLSNDYYWTGTTSSNWFTGTNWGSGIIPDSEDTVTINPGYANALIINGEAVCKRVMLNILNPGSGTSVATMKSGIFTLTSTYNSMYQFEIARISGGTGIFNMDGGTINIYSGMMIGSNGGGTGILNMNNGTINSSTGSFYGIRLDSHPTLKL